MSAVLQTVAVSEPRATTRPRRIPSERALIAGAFAGSETDLELLFRRHWSSAYRAAFLIVHDHAAAEDVRVQS